jgi:hypothetical protein
MAASNVRLWYTSSIPTGTGRSIISRAAGSRGREFRREDRRRSRRGQPVGAPEKSLQMAGGANRSRPIPEAGPGLVQRFHDCRIEPLSVQSEFREITRARGNIRPHPPNKRTRWRPTTRPSLEPGRQAHRWRDAVGHASRRPRARSGRHGASRLAAARPTTALRTHYWIRQKVSASPSGEYRPTLPNAWQSLRDKRRTMPKSCSTGIVRIGPA